ncbi:MAG: hypothetical protein D6791_08225, partial [Chloroflexi bacterium]
MKRYARSILFMLFIAALAAMPTIALAQGGPPAKAGLAALAPAGSVIYVDASSTCSGACGGSWGAAYPKLQDALAAAANGDEIWVAQGVYY